MKTKTKKTPLMTTETFGLTYSSSRLVLKSKFLRPDGSKRPKVERLHSLEAQHGFVPKLTRHSGKTVKTERRSQTFLDYAEVHPVFAETAKAPRFALKNRCALLNDVRNNCFLGFSFLLLKAAGCFQFVQLRRQAGLHSRMHEWKTNGCNPSTTEKGFGGFC